MIIFLPKKYEIYHAGRKRARELLKNEELH